MERRWLDFWRRVGAQGDSFRIYADLIARYTESHRFYHTFAHVAHCLDELETVRHLAIDSEALEMALWFHDAIYDTKARDNEEKSAELALNTAKRASLADDFARQVAVLLFWQPNTTGVLATLMRTSSLTSICQFWVARGTCSTSTNGRSALNTNGLRIKPLFPDDPQFYNHFSTGLPFIQRTSSGPSLKCKRGTTLPDRWHALAVALKYQFR